MSCVVSTNYQKLSPDQVQAIADECENAWQDPSLPGRQYELAAQKELETYRHGKPSAPFDALVRCLRSLMLGPIVRVLDVGASAGYYGEVMRIAGYDFKYTACDYSPAFQRMAEALYPGIDFDICDARNLPYRDGFYDIVLNGACIMHIQNFRKVIQESARVASRYVIFHRTPITPGDTSYFVKEGYGRRMLEIHFNEAELLDCFQSADLHPYFHTDVFVEATGFRHRSYVLRKTEGLTHVQV